MVYKSFDTRTLHPAFRVQALATASIVLCAHYHVSDILGEHSFDLGLLHATQRSFMEYTNLNTL